MTNDHDAISGTKVGILLNKQMRYNTTMPTQLPPVLTRGVSEVLPSAKTLAKLMNEKKIRLYLGIDPTGSLLTLGHSVLLRKLQQFAQLGHQVILLIGNGTVKIGDPTGKDSTRPELTNEAIEANFKTWKEQASKILDFDKIEIRYNGDWLDKMTLPDFIKLMAKTTVQQLIERDMFQKRLEENRPIHTHELMYPLLQGYDSVAMDVDLELGGTDQTFNMMMGRNLQKTYNDHEKWVLTTPIINGTDGRKMSKSYNNYVALNENPTDMYGKLMSITDEQIIPYFELLTDIEMSEIEQMKQAMSAGENPMTFKKRLAQVITTMYHDETAASEATEHFEQTVQSGNAVEDLKVDESQLSILELAELAREGESKSNLRRIIEQGGLQIDGKKHTDPSEVITIVNGVTLKVGKRVVFRLTVN